MSDFKRPSVWSWTIALFSIAKATWISLLIGYVVVVASILLEWREVASGAVLVCAALIGEVLFQRESWKKIVIPPSSMLELRRWNEENVDLWSGWLTYKASEYPIKSLAVLARKTEFSESGLSIAMHWNVGATFRRIDLWVSMNISISAIVGTLLWGYGDLAFG